MSVIFLGHFCSSEDFAQASEVATLLLGCCRFDTWFGFHRGMEDDVYNPDNDPEATEGIGCVFVYDPDCSRSVERLAARYQLAFGLSYQPTLAYKRDEGWRRWFPWRKSA